MDIIDIEILEDGKISIKTKDISEKNHMSADELLDMIDEMAGGVTEKRKREHEFIKNKRVLRGGKIVEM